MKNKKSLVEPLKVCVLGEKP